MENERTVTGMAEYIERKALRDALYDADAITMNGVKILNQFPSADVAPVRHGRWEWDTEDIYRCSKCGEKSHVKEVMGRPEWSYCPNCGAVMEVSNA